MARAPSAYLMTIKLNKEGKPYQHYLKDEKGQRILRETATPEQLAKSKNAVAVVEGGEAPAVSSKRQSQWLMVKKTAKNGKIYQHYLKDAKGQRIPRATATEEQLKMTTEVQGAKNEQAEKRAKKMAKKINKIQKAKAKHRKIAIDIQVKLRDAFDGQKKGKAALRSGEYYDRNTDYHAVQCDIETDWVLLHSITKKAQQTYTEEWFFFNPYNGDWKTFDIATYLAMPKHIRFIDWPVKSDKAIAA